MCDCKQRNTTSAHVSCCVGVGLCAGLSGSFNVLWTWSAPKCVQFAKLLSWQRVSRFPNSKPLTRKDQLQVRVRDSDSTGQLRHVSRPQPSALALALACFTCHGPMIWQRRRAAGIHHFGPS